MMPISLRPLRATLLAATSGFIALASQAQDTPAPTPEPVAAGTPATTPTVLEALRWEPGLFPGIAQATERDLMVAGAKALYPGRLRQSAGPAAPAPSPGEPAEPLRRELGPGRQFLRAGNASAAAAALAETAAPSVLVLDLRRAVSDAAGARALAAQLASKGPLTLVAAGNYPEFSAEADRTVTPKTGPFPKVTLVLTSKNTRGPVEAVLAALAARGDLITVGAATAGDTGRFEAFPAGPGWEWITGELSPAPGVSLLGSGATPVVPVPTPEQDEAAWKALQDGASIADVTQSSTEKRRFGESELIKAHARTAQPEAVPAPQPAATPTRDSSKAEQPLDLALRRALGILTALEALGRLPAATPTTTTAP